MYYIQHAMLSQLQAVTVHLSTYHRQVYKLIFLSCSHFYEIFYLLKHCYLLQAVVLTAAYLHSEKQSNWLP